MIILDGKKYYPIKIKLVHYFSYRGEDEDTMDTHIKCSSDGYITECLRPI